jgi:hypothetical protein
MAKIRVTLTRAIVMEYNKRDYPDGLTEEQIVQIEQANFERYPKMIFAKGSEVQEFELVSQSVKVDFYKEYWAE